MQKAHVSERKKKIVKELVELMNHKTLLLASIKNLPAAKLQEIRKNLRGKAEVKIAKKNLIDFALEHAKNEHLKELVSYVKEDCALLFSEQDAFELSAFLSDNKSSSKAKPGQIATEEIIVEAGATDLMPGPDISILSGVGLKVKIENGKIAIQDKKVLVRVGEAVRPEIAVILSKLNITPFKIGLEPFAAFSEGKIYTGIKVDREENLKELKAGFGKSLSLAVSITYICNESLPYILGKADAENKALSALIKSDSN